MADFQTTLLPVGLLDLWPRAAAVCLRFTQRKCSDSRSALLNTLKGVFLRKSANRGRSRALAAVCLQGEWAARRGMDTRGPLRGRSSKICLRSPRSCKAPKLGHLLLENNSLALLFKRGFQPPSLTSPHSSSTHQFHFFLSPLPSVPPVVGGREGR